MNINKKKALFALLGIALVCFAGYTTLSTMWASATIKMHAMPAGGISVAVTLWEGMVCTDILPATAHDWDGVMEGNVYEWSLFIKNSGAELLYITYLPTDFYANDNQTHFILTCNVVMFGIPCQLNDIPKVPLPEKNYLVPTNGYPLTPGKMIKIDIELTVISVVVPGTYDWDFVVYGATA
jgi:hypothetical protein